MRVQTAVVAIGLSMTFLAVSAAGHVGETTMRTLSPSTLDQVAMNDRRDLTSLPGAAAMMLNERAAFAGRARDESASVSAATSSVVASEVSTEPHPAMMLLSVLALIAYVIGRRGVQRG